MSGYLNDRLTQGMRLITPPAFEPVSVAMAKQHLRLETSSTTDYPYIASLVRAARAYAEQFTRRAFYKQTWKLTLDRFPAWGNTDDSYWFFRRGFVNLIKPPVMSVDEIAYVDTNGTRTVIDPSAYRVDLQDGSARIEPAYGQSWPVTQFSIATVEITHKSGYTDGIKNADGSPPDNAPADGDPKNLVPDPIKMAILLLVGAFYENREEMIVGQLPARLPFGAEDLLSPYRVMVWP